ncbi:MAG TPA: FkbM family methyltransferase, partial [Flavisolibacter sp.]
MSRFKRLRQHLPVAEALRLYSKIKYGKLEQLRISKLHHPFNMRDNPFDYATFEEVLLRETYDISLPFTPECVIDGGGNIGLTAAWFATKYPSAQIVSIEPDQENFELLVRNTQAYGNVTPLHAGIWNRSAHLVVRNTGAGNNGFVVDEAAAGTPGAIESLGIPDIMQRMGWDRVDILKLDVEGSEKMIFADGTDQWLPRTRVLIVELHDRMQKGSSRTVFAALTKYNFSMDIAGENLVFFNEDL